MIICYLAKANEELIMIKQTLEYSYAQHRLVCSQEWSVEAGRTVGVRDAEGWEDGTAIDVPDLISTSVIRVIPDLCHLQASQTLAGDGELFRENTENCSEGGEHCGKIERKLSGIFNEYFLLFTKMGSELCGN